jgi:hypothetical protein
MPDALLPYKIGDIVPKWEDPNAWSDRLTPSVRPGNARKLERHGLNDLKAYAGKFMDRLNYVRYG